MSATYHLCFYFIRPPSTVSDAVNHDGETVISTVNCDAETASNGEDYNGESYDAETIISAVNCDTETASNAVNCENWKAYEHNSGLFQV